MSTAFFETLNSHPDPINVLDHECFHIQVVDSLVASPERPYIRNLGFYKTHTEGISGQTCHARLDATLTLLGRGWLKGLVGSVLASATSADRNRAGSCMQVQLFITL